MLLGTGVSGVVPSATMEMPALADAGQSTWGCVPAYRRLKGNDLVDNRWNREDFSCS